ncbi:MAG TPA: alpha/beta family hydrolase [Candidatus Limnocylindrales bacterium]|nr:alpha/beta family hydrolase [Candidatus Limnocylindrales bacterium]
MAVRFYVAHGASGSAASMAGHVRGLVARAIDARAIDLPVRKAEDAVAVFRTIVPDGPDATEARADTESRPPQIAVGGQSYGGRVASLAAAEDGTRYAGLVVFSYPLHPPGSPAKADERTAHWPAIRCPVLLLSGERDPFARLDLLRERVPLLRDGRLVTYPNLGHTLRPVLDDALDRAAAFLLELA